MSSRFLSSVAHTSADAIYEVVVNSKTTYYLNKLAYLAYYD